MAALTIKRVYEPASPRDGRRILVDRIWPRGLTKKSLNDVLWCKDAAPSTKLRKWFGHKPERWGEFRRRYFAELRENRDAVALLRTAMKRGRVTLLYSAHDTEHNQAVALSQFLTRSRMKRSTTEK
jgi:uncharacterized protein YeaO (DUF488 family)